MKFKIAAAAGITGICLGFAAGTMLPKPKQNYGMVIVTGTTIRTPAMKEYVEKVEALIKHWGCEIVALDRDTLRMEGEGGPLTVVKRCPNATEQDQIDLYESDEYQELVELRAPFTDWDFRILQAKF